LKIVPSLARVRSVARQVGISLVVILLTLLAMDLLLIGTGAFPPTYEYGDAELGWATIAPETLPYDWCIDGATQTRYDYYRNELGIRTRFTKREIEATDRFIVAEVGDSHSDLCAPNDQTHQGVLEAELNGAGLDSLVLSNGVGRYSPLQEYLLFKQRLRPFNPGALVLNLYTGNDFIDILRMDDRPHFVRAGDHYEIAPPVWYRYYDPDAPRYSRVMFVTRSLLDRIGIRNIYLRLRLLNAAAGREGEGLGTVLRYIMDIRRSTAPSVGYSGALAAQFLNQQLYLHYFPASESEALRRTRELMRLAREENPGIALVMSPIPSYQLVARQPVDAALTETLARLPLTFEQGVEQEERLYYALRDFSREEGWVFVDNLAPLRAYRGNERLYNDFDYHITPAASAIIGKNEAEAILRLHGTSNEPRVHQ